MSWPHLVRLDVSKHGENAPCDPLAKRIVASNLDHLAASHGQVLANWACADGNGITRSFAPLNSGERAMWQAGGEGNEGFPLRMRADGSAFRIRVRLRGRRRTAGDPVTFKVTMSGMTRLSAHFVTSSTSSSWLTPEASPYDALFSPGPDDVRGLVYPFAVPETLGGPRVAPNGVFGFFTVSCLMPQGSAVELTGVHIAEFHGA